MTQLKFDKKGRLLRQTVNYRVKHDEQTEDLIEKYINDKCDFQPEFNEKGEAILGKKEKSND